MTDLPQQRDPNDPRRANPFTVALVWVAVGAATLALVLVLAGVAAADASSWRGGDAALIAGLTVWSDYLMTVGVVAAVGAVVLAGVRWVLRRAGLDV